MKIYLKTLGYIGIGILSATLLLTIIHYFNLIGDKTTDIIKLVIAIISIGAGGFIVGQSSNKKGWLSGLKLAGMIIILFFLMTIIFRLGLSTKNLIYYLIIIASSTIGSMIGISTKEKKK
jgi:putative membrane protein (TIGR04086 family)